MDEAPRKNGSFSAPPLLVVPKTNSGKHRKLLFAFVFLIGVLILGTLVLREWKTPKAFPVGEIVEIKEGETLGAVATTLENRNLVTSAFWFQVITALVVGERNIKAGTYLFENKLTLTEVIKKLSRGEYGFAVIKVTVPEGLSVPQIGDIFSQRLDSFSGKEFTTLALPKEGYLFPETYSFPKNATPEDVITKMFITFSEKIKPLEAELLASGHTLKEITTMASILEEEAKTTESRKIVSGILWKRIELKMPLQVDAAFSHVNGKSTYDLTTNDLKIDSPYNTYKYLGLPPTPISNPGLDSIEATLRPILSKYLYYLSERDGTMHYAQTYAEHLKNKAQYIPR